MENSIVASDSPLVLSNRTTTERIFQFVSGIATTESEGLLPGSSFNSTIYIPKGTIQNEDSRPKSGIEVGYLNRLAEVYDLLAAANAPRAQVAPRVSEDAAAGLLESSSSPASEPSPSSEPSSSVQIPPGFLRDLFPIWHQMHTPYETRVASRGVLQPNAVLSYRRVAVGGTFDRLHVGHQLLLAASALVCGDGGFLYIGITADALLANKKYRELLQSYEEREATALRFVLDVRPDIVVQTGALSDPKAPTAAELDPDMEALVVSDETIAGGVAINENRAARGFAPLDIVVVPVIGIFRRPTAPASDPVSDPSPSSLSSGLPTPTPTNGTNGTNGTTTEDDDNKINNDNVSGSDLRHPALGRATGATDPSSPSPSSSSSATQASSTSAGSNANANTYTTANTNVNPDVSASNARIDINVRPGYSVFSTTDGGASPASLSPMAKSPVGAMTPAAAEGLFDRKLSSTGLRLIDAQVLASRSGK